jgi:hypothetical protein
MEEDYKKSLTAYGTVCCLARHAEPAEAVDAWLAEAFAKR